MSWMTDLPISKWEKSQGYIARGTPMPPNNVAGLIYNGIIPLEVAEYIRRSENHYWAEIMIDNESDPETRERPPAWRAFWEEFHEWENGPDGLVLYDCVRDSDWGPGKEHYKSHRFCFYNRFCGFYTAAEHARFCARFGDRVNPQPFKTTL